MPNALFLRHTPYVGPDIVGDWADARGYASRVIDAPAGALNDEAQAIAAADLLVILGGNMGVYEADAHPWIATEIALTRARLATKKPTLGLCFGAQLMAAALGARVYKGAVNEVGWNPLPVLQGLLEPVAGIPVLQWHHDTFDLPAGARLLASNAIYPRQAFAHGAHALALQFHLETSAQGLAAWLEDGHNEPELLAVGLTGERLLADARAAERATRPAAFAVLDAWIAHAA